MPRPPEPALVAPAPKPSAAPPAGRLADPAWLAYERACVARARGGDGDAFAALYHAFAGALYARVLLPRLGDPTAAEEALAETFRTALERLDRVEDRGVSVYFWLARVAERKAADQWRARGRGRRALASFDALLAPLREPEPEPDAALDQRRDLGHLRARVARALARLHPRYRRLLELRFFEELPRVECAAALGVAIGNFDVLQLRALRAFRTLWEGALDPEP